MWAFYPRKIIPFHISSLCVNENTNVFQFQVTQLMPASLAFGYINIFQSSYFILHIISKHAYIMLLNHYYYIIKWLFYKTIPTTHDVFQHPACLIFVVLLRINMILLSALKLTKYLNLNTNFNLLLYVYYIHEIFNSS